MDVTAHASLLRSLAEQTYGNLAGEPLRDTATVDPEHPQREEEREVMNVIRQNRDELRAFDAADRDGQERMLERQRGRVRAAQRALANIQRFL